MKRNTIRLLLQFRLLRSELVAFVLFYILISLTSYASAQYPEGVAKSVDSLRNIYSKLKSDTDKISVLTQWSDLISSFDVEGSRDKNLDILKIAERRIGDKKTTGAERQYFLQQAGLATQIIGSYYRRNGSAELALENYRQSRNYLLEAKDYQGCAKTFYLMSTQYAHMGKFDEAWRTASRAIKQYRSAGDPEGICDCYLQLGQLLAMKGQLDSALAQFDVASRYCGKAGDEDNLGDLENSIGNVYLMQGNLTAAMHHYTACLEVYEKLKDVGGIAISLNNIGYVYTLQENNVKAAENYIRAANLTINSSDKLTRMNANFSLASGYHCIMEFDSALQCYRTISEISLELGSIREYAFATSSIGGIFLEMQEYDSAFPYLEKGLDLCRGMQDPVMVISALSGMGQYYVAKKNWIKARSYMEECYHMAKMANSPNELEKITGILSEILENLGEYSKALEVYEEHVSVHESNKNENQQRDVIQAEYEMKYRLQSSQDSIANAVKLAEGVRLNAEKQRARDAEISRQNWQQAGLFGGLLLVVVFSVVIFNRFRLTNRQKETIKSQHEKLDEKNREVLSSISYAKRIQDAILPPQSFFQAHIPDSFILYRPKDIVAGDFYWLEKSGDVVFLAVADCTGHGVPGAMVSVVCHNALKRAVREFKLTRPGEILNKTREFIIETFEKSESAVKDGMDIALVAWNTKTGTMEFAGANNSLYCLKGSDIEIVTANKQPVGVYVDAKPFDTKIVNVGRGDIVYLFSDGFADQFGGEKGKKMKYNNFRALIAQIAGMPLLEQGIVLEREFNKWRGDFEQIDDVCVIGLRL